MYIHSQFNGDARGLGLLDSHGGIISTRASEVV